MLANYFHCGFQDLHQYKTKNKGSAKGFSGATEVGPELLYEKHDILVLAAMEKTLTQNNVKELNCKVRRQRSKLHRYIILGGSCRLGNVTT